MNNRQKQIGFSQRVRLEWFQQTANLILAGNGKETINGLLQELLQNKLSVGSTSERGSRAKAITILMKIWVNVPEGLNSLRDGGLNLLKTMPSKSHIAVHWGMIMAVYPFWGAVAASVGRLLHLQGTAAVAQVQRRIREQYGERETVSRATQRIIRTFVDWGVLEETSVKGVYRKGQIIPVTDPALIGWLVEAFLHANNGSGVLKAVLDAPSLFPFQIEQISAERLVAASSRLEAIRHSLDDNLIMLRSTK